MEEAYTIHVYVLSLGLFLAYLCVHISKGQSWTRSVTSVASVLKGDNRGITWFAHIISVIPPSYFIQLKDRWADAMAKHLSSLRFVTVHNKTCAHWSPNGSSSKLCSWSRLHLSFYGDISFFFHKNQYSPYSIRQILLKLPHNYHQKNKIMLISVFTQLGKY